MFSRTVLRTPFKRVVGQVRNMGGGHHGEVILHQLMTVYYVYFISTVITIIMYRNQPMKVLML